MPKITLPPCVYHENKENHDGMYFTKCELCQGHDTICEDYTPEGGFDAVAAAVDEAKILTYEVCDLVDEDGKTIHEAKIELVSNEFTDLPHSGNTLWFEHADKPTAALVAACVAYNTEENGDE